MKLFTPLFFILGCCFFLTGQTTTKDSVLAEKGDGIFSILRKQGLDPVKYYGDFLELNADSLKNGSEIVFGRTYIIPQAPDSYKEMGIRINADDASETSIFGQEFATFNKKSDKLENAVIYLISASSLQKEFSNQNVAKDDILKSVAKELLLNGAKVYLIEGNDEADMVIKDKESEEEETTMEAPMAGLENMRNYVELINTAFLKNSGKQKYQRILVIDLKQGAVAKKYHRVSVFHDDNVEGERFANNMQQIFNKSKILDDSKDFTAIFAQKNNLFLVKNALPPLTFIELGETEDPKIEGRIKVKPDKKWLSDVITNGIVNDYTQLEIQD